MSIDATTIYLWQLADRLIPFTATAAALLSLIAFVLLICHLCTKSNAADSRASAVKYFNSKMEYEAKAVEQEAHAVMLWNCFRRLIKYPAVLWLVFLVVPSSNTVAMMVVIPRIADSKVVRQDLPDLYNAAIEALKKELKP